MTKEKLAQANELNARIATLNSYLDNINSVLNNAKSLTEPKAQLNLDAMFEIDNGSLTVLGEYTVPILHFLLHTVIEDIGKLQTQFDNL